MHRSSEWLLDVPGGIGGIILVPLGGEVLFLCKHVTRSKRLTVGAAVFKTKYQISTPEGSKVPLNSNNQWSGPL